MTTIEFDDFISQEFFSGKRYSALLLDIMNRFNISKKAADCLLSDYLNVFV